MGDKGTASVLRYQVASLYDEHGEVAPHFVNDEFHSFCDTWEHAMANPQFAAIIERELRAEEIAGEPLDFIAELAPSERVGAFYLRWLSFIDGELEPWTTGGAIHFRPHWARVLMHALAIGDALGLPDADLNALAMASVFHDSRRKSPYLDTGHGARAAAYYADACGAVGGGGPGGSPACMPLEHDHRAFLAIAWHDRDDEEGLEAARRAEGDGLVSGDALPEGASADACTVLRIFKDADALDRVRLGEGGLDESYLRTEQARHQVDFARELLAATEQGR